MSNLEEIRIKEQRARELMASEGLDALALSTIGNFAWVTGGGNNHVGLASDAGVATAVITKDAKYIVSSNIESGRVRDEEVAGLGFESIFCNWYEDNSDELIKNLAGGGVLGSDVPMAGAKDISAALDPYRYCLTPDEIERYKWVGKNASECLTLACNELELGMSEHQIAGFIAKHAVERGMVTTVTLVAADERIGKYRHPIPTDKKVEKYVMLVLGARRWGLITSVTRLVHFGELSPELRRKHDAVARVDAAYITASKVGTRIGDVFQKAVDTYAETGFGEEWKLHHQGGPTGYKAREYRATIKTDAIVLENQALAWNPSITGTKTEDTIIATPSGIEIISEDKNWPMIEVTIDGEKIMKPDILIR